MCKHMKLTRSTSGSIPHYIYDSLNMCKQLNILNNSYASMASITASDECHFTANILLSALQTYLRCYMTKKDMLVHLSSDCKIVPFNTKHVRNDFINLHV